MRLVTFTDREGSRVGLLDRESVRDVTVEDAGLPRDMAEFCAEGPSLLSRVQRALDAAPRLPLSEVRLQAPLPRPRRNIFCVGKNYYAHAREFHDSGFDAFR